MRVRLSHLPLAILIASVPTIASAEISCRGLSGEARNACLRAEIEAAQAKLAYWDNVKRLNKDNKRTCPAASASGAATVAPSNGGQASGGMEKISAIAGGALPNAAAAKANPQPPCK